MSGVVVPISQARPAKLSVSQKISRFVKNIKALKIHITFEEGIRNTVYFDKKKIPTVGIGFNLQRKDADKQLKRIGTTLKRVMAGEQLTETQVNTLFDNTLLIAILDAKKQIKIFAQLSENRQNVLVDMSFQLGLIKFRKFKGMLSAVNKGQFEKASNEIVVNSKGKFGNPYFKQSPKRAQRNLDRMLLG